MAENKLQGKRLISQVELCELWAAAPVKYAFDVRIRGYKVVLPEGHGFLQVAARFWTRERIEEHMQHKLQCNKTDAKSRRKRLKCASRRDHFFQHSPTTGKLEADGSLTPDDVTRLNTEYAKCMALYGRKFFGTNDRGTRVLIKVREGVILRTTLAYLNYSMFEVRQKVALTLKPHEASIRAEQREERLHRDRPKSRPASGGVGAVLSAEPSKTSMERSLHAAAASEDMMTTVGLKTASWRMMTADELQAALDSGRFGDDVELKVTVI